jgi:hypothetical protein
LICFTGHYVHDAELTLLGLGGFANIIINGFKFSVLETQLLAMVLGAVIIITLISATWLVNKTQQNLIVMAIYVIP